MKKIFFTCLLIVAAMAGYSQTYYWVGGAGPVSFSTNSNWNTMQNGSGTTRGAATATDILIIDGTNIGGSTPATGTVTATVTSTNLGQLRLSGGANVVLKRATAAGGTGTITVSGSTGDDLVIDAGSTLSVNSNGTDGTVVIAMTAAATASISGNLSISNTAQNRITNQAAGAFVFNSGSTFTTNITPASAAYPFGSSSQSVEKGVVFLPGANLMYEGGFSPFGNSSTFSAIDLRPGSNWYHRVNNPTSSFGTFSNGKGFGNLIVESGATFTCDGPAYRIGNLTVNSGSTFTTHTSGQTAILENMTINGTYTAGTGSNSLVLGGSGTQTISGTGTINAPSIVVGDNSTVVLNRDITVATSLTVFGKIDFRTFQVGGAGTFSARTNVTNGPYNGTYAAGSYQITAVTGIAGTLNGLTISGAGIPPNTTVVGSSPANGTINLSQPVTAAGTATALSFKSDTATLATSNPNGMDATNGSVIQTGNLNFETGTNYIINGATTKPFGISTGAVNTFIQAGFVEVNAPITVNKGITVYNHLTVNGKITLRPLDTVYITNGAVVNGTFGGSNYIATIANTTTGDQSVVRLDNVTVATTIPVGSTANYLPVTLTPAAASDFTVAAFEGITSQGTPNGTPLSAAQKQSVVDAIWTVKRINGTGNTGLQLGWTTALEGSTFNTLPNTDIGIIYNTGSSYTLPAGTADNSANTASHTITDFGAYSLGAVPPSQPFTFNPLSARTYGNPDFNGGAFSLNTTKPIVYTSSNPAVATIVANNIHIVGAGTTNITASQESDGFYPAASGTQPLLINPAALEIKADKKSRFEGQPNPPLTATYTGFVLGETPAVLLTPAVLTTPATVASPPGDYLITVSDATAANYTITFVKDTLTVIPKQTQTITFNAPPVKTYGNADFPAGATSTNPAIPITYTSSNTAVATIVGNNIHIVGAGTSNITASQAGDIGHFPAPDVTRTLTVNKAALTIRVRDTLKMQGEVNPPFTITYTGFVLGQNASNLLTPPVATTTAMDISSPGYYPITLSGATSNNYNITYVHGRLTILPPGGGTQQYINAYMSNSTTLTVRVFSVTPVLGDVIVYDMSGRPLLRRNLFMPAGFISVDIPVATLPSALYVVTVQGDGVDLRKTIPIIK